MAEMIQTRCDDERTERVVYMRNLAHCAASEGEKGSGRREGAGPESQKPLCPFIFLLYWKPAKPPISYGVLPDGSG